MVAQATEAKSRCYPKNDSRRAQKHYKQVQAVQSQTEKKLVEEKVAPKGDELPDDLPNKPPVYVQDITTQTISGPTRRLDRLPEPPRYPIAPAPVLPVKPQTILEPPATIEPVRNISKEFTTAYNDLMTVAK